MNSRKMPGTGLYGRGRVLVWFSCGAASAVAAKLAVETYPDVDLELLYCDTLKYEHPDNLRFMRDVERWTGRPVKLLASDRFTDIFDVFRRERYLNGRHGAPCTRALKRNVRKAYQQPNDLHVFGYTADEQSRVWDFEDDNPGLECAWILLDRGITKTDCYRVVHEVGIELPVMYRLGYGHNNCIGCVKGGAGYWNKVRRDFPEAFDRMAKMERELEFALLKVKGKPCYLDELPLGAGRYADEPDIECGPQCVAPAPAAAAGGRPVRVEAGGEVEQ